MTRAGELAANATEIEWWDTPWAASLHKTDEGQIVYLSDGDDSEVYQNREAAIAAQNQWLEYADSDSEEERTWAEMAQQIVDALT
jgi:hypothetical protein